MGLLSFLLQFGRSRKLIVLHWRRYRSGYIRYMLPRGSRVLWGPLVMFRPRHGHITRAFGLGGNGKGREREGKGRGKWQTLLFDSCG